MALDYKTEFIQAVKGTPYAGSRPGMWSSFLDTTARAGRASLYKWIIRPFLRDLALRSETVKSTGAVSAISGLSTASTYGIFQKAAAEKQLKYSFM